MAQEFEADGEFLTWVSDFFFSFLLKKKKSSLEGSEWQRESSRAGCTSALFVLHPDRHRWLWLQQLPFIPVCAPLIPNANLLL